MKKSDPGDAGGTGSGEAFDVVCCRDATQRVGGHSERAGKTGQNGELEYAERGRARMACRRKDRRDQYGIGARARGFMNSCFGVRRGRDDPIAFLVRTLEKALRQMKTIHAEAARRSWFSSQQQQASFGPRHTGDVLHRGCVGPFPIAAPDQRLSARQRIECRQGVGQARGIGHADQDDPSGALREAPRSGTQLRCFPGGDCPLLVSAGF